MSKAGSVRMKKLRALCGGLLCFAFCLACWGSALALEPYEDYGMSESYKAGIYYRQLCDVTLTGDMAKDLAAVALSQVHYMATDDTADFSGNGELGGFYAEYGLYVGAIGQDWGAAFISWCAEQARIGSDIIPRSPIMASYRACGEQVEEPRVGDLILFNPWLKDAEGNEVMIGNTIVFYDEWTPERPADVSRVGIVTGYDPACREVTYISGNDHDEVQVRTDSLDSVTLGEDGAYDVPCIQQIRRPDYAQAQEKALDAAIYDAAETAGVVDNAQAPAEDSQAPQAPAALDVVLVVDCSGSMDLSNPGNGKRKITYAQDAACAFIETVFALSPDSRIALVSYASDVVQLSDFLPASQSDELQSRARSMGAGGMTNTGGGYELAQTLLREWANAGSQPLVLMLSDGLANEGPDPVIVGENLAAEAMVYTIGLVGGLSAQEREATRATLNAGYETRYFEVDFDNMGDISEELYDAFLSIAMMGARGEHARYYRLLGSGALALRVAGGEAGEELRSPGKQASYAASFGSLNLMGDERSRKAAYLVDGDYTIFLRSRLGGRGSYQLNALTGAGKEALLEGMTAENPYTTTIVTVSGGQADAQEIAFNPIDPDATDPFTQRQSTGPESCATGYALKAGNLLAAPDKAAYRLAALKKTCPCRCWRSQRTVNMRFSP